MDIYVYMDGREYNYRPCTICIWQDITYTTQTADRQYLAVDPCAEHRESVSLYQAKRLLTGQ